MHTQLFHDLLPRPIMQLDATFNTTDVHRLLSLHNTPFSIVPPYEHQFNGVVERYNRTIQDKLFTSLLDSTLRNRKIWGYALHDTVLKLNISPNAQLNWKSPYELWHNHPYDFKNHPLLPFGYQVLAHVPTSIQTKLSNNSILTYCVGTSQTHPYCIQLFDRSTKYVIHRRAFKVLDASTSSLTNPIIHTYPESTLSDSQFYKYFYHIYTHSLFGYH
jgi:hypothetical protein